MDLKLSFFVSSNMLPVNVLYFETVSTAMLQLMYKPIVYRRVFVNYLLVHLTFIYIIPDSLRTEIERKFTCFYQFWQDYGIANFTS